MVERVLTSGSELMAIWKRVIWDCSLQSDSGHPFSSPLSKNSRNTVYKLRFANVLGRINGDLKKVIWDCSLQSDSEHPIFSPLSKNSRNTVYKLRFASLRISAIFHRNALGCAERGSVHGGFQLVGRRCPETNFSNPFTMFKPQFNPSFTSFE